jgi:hypothetical protein
MRRDENVTTVVQAARVGLINEAEFFEFFE